MPEPQESPPRVFISSTVRDLFEHRQQVRDVRLRMGLEVEMYDTLPPGPDSALELLRGAIARADIYIGIIGYRYGGIPDGHDISWTELEYDYATQLQKPRLIFIMGETHPIIAENVGRGAGKTTGV